MPRDRRTGIRDRDRHYAIAVRAGADLLLVQHAVRNWKGEFFYMWRRRERPWDDPLWNPKASAHRDGRRHQKSFDCKFGQIRREKPDAAFTGSEQFVQTSIAWDEAQALNIPCTTTDFEGVFEIDHTQLRQDDINPTQISIDFTAADTTPRTILELQPLGLRIIKQGPLYSDSVPWFWATLFDVAPLKVETEAGAQARQAEKIECAKLLIEGLEALRQERAPGTPWPQLPWMTSSPGSATGSRAASEFADDQN